MHVGIIGGGFAGGACAPHLMRGHPKLRAQFSIVEPPRQVAAVPGAMCWAGVTGLVGLTA